MKFIKIEKLYMVIIFIVSLIALIISIFNLIENKNLKQNISDISNKIKSSNVDSELISNNEQNEFLTKMDGITPANPENDDDRILKEKYDELKKIIEANYLDKKIRLIFEKNKEEFQKNTDPDSKEIAEILNKFLICCNEFDKAKKDFNNKIETSLRQGNAKYPELLLANQNELMKEKMKIQEGRDYLKNFANMLDVNILIFPELTKRVQETNDDLEKILLNEIKSHIMQKTRLLKKQNNELQKNKNGMPRMFNKIFFTNNK